MVNLKYSIKELPEVLGECSVPDNCDLDTAILHVASHFYFGLNGWQNGWPLQFVIHYDNNTQYEYDVFIMGVEGVKPIFEAFQIHN